VPHELSADELRLPRCVRLQRGRSQTHNCHICWLACRCAGSRAPSPHSRKPPMNRQLHTTAAALALLGAAFAAQADSEGRLDRDRIHHVLLISVDGLHAVDLSNYVQKHPESTLAQLSEHGVTYTNASTSTPSDSFPGLAGLVTGGSPTTTGFWYDV